MFIYGATASYISSKSIIIAFQNLPFNNIINIIVFYLYYLKSCTILCAGREMKDMQINIYYD